MKKKYQFLIGFKYVRIIFILIIISLNIGCDQASKQTARANINFNEKINVISDIFYLTKVENTGAMLSIGSKLPDYLRTILLLCWTSCLKAGSIGLICVVNTENFPGNG